MPRPRFERLEPARQERLFEAAARAFADHGYDGASLNRVLEEAGMSKGSLYYYFNDKADFFDALLDRAVARMISDVGGFSIESLTASTFWPALDGFVERSARFFAGSGWAVRLLRAWPTLRGAPRERVLRLMRRVTSSVLQRGQELGEIRADVPLAYLVEATLALGEAGDRWLLENWDTFGAAERDHLVVLQMGMFRRMLSSRVPDGMGE